MCFSTSYKGPRQHVASSSIVLGPSKIIGLGTLSGPKGGEANIEAYVGSCGNFSVLKTPLEQTIVALNYATYIFINDLGPS